MATAKVNGAELYYEENGSGPPIILSPGGLQGVASSYSPVVGALSQEHRVIVYDRRFGGQSRSPMVVQTWEMVCDDVFGLMDALGLEQSILGGGSFGAAISFGCAYRRPERVRAIFPSNIAGGVICDGYLTSKVFKSMEIAAADGIGAVIDAFDADDRFAPYSPEIAQTDAEYRKNLEAMDTEEFIQVMRDTAHALFGGPFPTLGSTKEMLRSIRVPTMIMPGYNDVHPRSVAEMAHRNVPNSQWGECKPHSDEPEKYAKRVLEFLAEVEANGG
ncbi:Putative aminoacrylate hydrolase RutD [Geodia barretti]|uniref:Aminoacrylate hydrolase RutD n=1 Tax=Geodia barretti TaxID=519541 RepID=A0AA35TAW5_GEOBA|nr:Putative aminoacrylate hydrolase RutD [Geodia barretti]